MSPGDTAGTRSPESAADFDSQVSSIAALAEPARRDLYRFVVAQSDPVSREEAAAGTGVALHVAKFHLDKLVGDGLLDVGHRRPPGRGGPGAGRPAKVYRRAEREMAVSLPPRRYEFAGHLMARAIDDAERDGVPVAQAMRESAQAAGRSLGGDALERAGSRPSRSDLQDAVIEVLEESSYEPRRQAGGVIMVNCPFHSLARDYRDLACGMNLDLMSGLVAGLEGVGFDARLEPVPGRCCVVLRDDQASAEPGSAEPGAGRE
ncbi:MAG TPA: helix-turn-helix domain-containing protein [Acidimicrobiales bacterium]|jgi:predicted ArsR family transcriptional regulator